MFDIHDWMNELILRLKQTFGTRLIAVGLQGSFKRGEAHGKSDIDAVVVLDSLSLEDLNTYKHILAQMPPSSHPACGFIAGQEDLKNWSRAELFQFAHDTDTLYGSFKDILPTPTRLDARLAAQASAGALFHALCHTQVHGTVTPEFLAQLYKGAFFILQALYFMRTGKYISSKQALKAQLKEEEAEIMHCLQTGNFTSASAQLLLRWTQNVLKETAQSVA